MRTLSLVLLLALAGCSEFFHPPCDKLARAVCDVGSEGDACAFLLNVKRDDRHAQSVCEGLVPAAQALQANQNGPDERAAWVAARSRLQPLGLVANDRAGRIDEKLKAAGGTAGRLVEKAEGAFHEGEAKTTEGAERAFDAVDR
jgi:hypothetical protein